MSNLIGVVPDGEGVRIRVQVAPRASSSGIMGTYGEEAIRVRLNAPPVDGKANAELLRFLAETLRIPSRSISLLSGETSRRKVVKVENISLEDVKQRLKL